MKVGKYINQVRYLDRILNSTQIEHSRVKSRLISIKASSLNGRIFNLSSSSAVKENCDGTKMGFDPGTSSV